MKMGLIESKRWQGSEDQRRKPRATYISNTEPCPGDSPKVFSTTTNNQYNHLEPFVFVFVSTSESSLGHTGTQCCRTTATHRLLRGFLATLSFPLSTPPHQGAPTLLVMMVCCWESLSGTWPDILAWVCYWWDQRRLVMSLMGWSTITYL